MSWFTSSVGRGFRVRSRLGATTLVMGILGLSASPISCQTILGIEDGTPLPPTCANRVTDTSTHESDTDCGGQCAGCRTGRRCRGDSDCLSKNCVASTCRPVATGAMAFDTIPYSLDDRPLASVVLKPWSEANDGGTGVPNRASELYILNSGTNSLSLVYPRPTGDLPHAFHIPLEDPQSATRPTSLAVGDFNKDNQLDLVTAYPDKGHVTVFYRAGQTQAVGERPDDGSAAKFDVGQAYSAGSSPSLVISADVNGDGVADIVAGGDKLTTLVSNGDRSFRNVEISGVGPDVSAIAIADLDGDAKLDLVVASSSGTTLSLLIGDGTGGFAAPTTLDVPGGTIGIASGDFDGDGSSDIAVINAGSTDVTVFSNQGKGMFHGNPKVVPSGVNGPKSIAAGNLNGDGAGDLVVGSSTGGVSVLLGSTQGGLGTGAAVATGASSDSILIADVNADTFADLVVPSTTDNLTSVLLGDGKGAFASPRKIGAASEFSKLTTFQSGIAIVHSKQRLVSLAGFDVPGRRVTMVGTILLDSEPAALSDFDIDRTEPRDLLVASGQGYTVWIGQPGWTYNKGDEFGSGLNPVWIGAVQNNDVVVVNEGSNDVYLRLRTDNTFGSVIQFPVGTGPVALCQADMDGAEMQDFVVANSGANSVHVVTRSWNNQVKAIGEFPAGSKPIAVVAFDINEDGSTDVVTANAGDGTVAVLLGKGGGQLSPPTTFPCGGTPVALAIEDYNLDGRVDLAVVNQAEANLAVLFGRGDGSFDAPSTFPVGAEPMGLISRDANNDEAPDLLVASKGDRSLSLFLNTTPQNRP